MMRTINCQWSTIVGTGHLYHPTQPPTPAQDSGASWKRGWKECKSGRMGREWWMDRTELLHTWTQSNCAHPHIFKCSFPQHPSLWVSGSKPDLCRMLQLRDKWEFWRLCWPKVIWVLKQIVSQGQQEWLSPLCSSGQRNVPIWLTVLESCWMCAQQSKWVIALCFLSASLLRAWERKVN